MKRPEAAGGGAQKHVIKHFHSANAQGATLMEGCMEKMHILTWKACFFDIQLT